MTEVSPYDRSLGTGSPARVHTVNQENPRPFPLYRVLPSIPAGVPLYHVARASIRRGAFTMSSTRA